MDGGQRIKGPAPSLHCGFQEQEDERSLENPQGSEEQASSSLESCPAPFWGWKTVSEITPSYAIKIVLLAEHPTALLLGSSQGEILGVQSAICSELFL